MTMPPSDGLDAGPAWIALVVEDEAIIAGAIEDALLSLGAAEVRLARTEREALAGIDGGDVSVAIVDLHLGRERADGLFETLAGRGVPVIVVTGAHPEETRLIEARVTAVVQKPFRDRTLIEAVRLALGRA